MGLFTDRVNEQAFLKVGFMGFAGDGKTFTASMLAAGLVSYMKEKGLKDALRPAFFLDTETGSDWVKPWFEKKGIKLHTYKSRAFTDLLEAIKEAEQESSVLIIDSVTHFWRELCETYVKKKNRKYGLQFQDWANLKAEWGKFTDLFVNSKVHTVLCGRAGYEYDFFTRDDGKKELEKTGIKMKAEGETGYEPSLLVLMEKHRNMESGETYRTGTILKDRSTLIDGKTFKNPKFEDFLPHVNFLNLGGEHVGIDTKRDSSELFAENGETKTKYYAQQKEICLDEIAELLKKHHPSSGAADKKARQELLEKHAGSMSWKKVETYRFDDLKTLRNTLWLELERRPYGTAEEVKQSEQASAAC